MNYLAPLLIISAVLSLGLWFFGWPHKVQEYNLRKMTDYPSIFGIRELWEGEDSIMLWFVRAFGIVLIGVAFDMLASILFGTSLQHVIEVVVHRIF